ncbi:MAG: hypothetical protein QUS35_01925 [bacterium]|nr:hypothetical protein [bacterium]
MSDPIRRGILRWPAFCLLIAGFLPSAFGQNGNTDAAKVTVPWDEFRKIIRMDENEIVLPIETYNRLVAQTGQKPASGPAVRNGLVVLSRAEFSKLVEAMKPPADSSGAPPVDYLVTRAAYSGRLGRNGTRFTATFRIHVLRRNAWLKIPLLYQSAALEEVRTDGAPGLVVTEGGTHQALIGRSGEHTVEAVFTVPSEGDQGPQRLDLAILPAPVRLLRLELPMRNIDVDVPRAQAFSVEPGGAGTVVAAVIPAGASIQVAWRRKVPAAEKLPPKVYADVNHLISIEDGGLRVVSDVGLNVLHSGVEQAVLSVPADLNVLSVTGDAVGAWQERTQAGQRLVTVPFTYAREGAVTFTVTTEKPLTEGGKSNAFRGFRVSGAVRETGAVGVALNTGAEVKAVSSEGLERVAVQKLPPALYNRSEKPLLLAYRTMKHPFTLVLDVERHEKIIVPMASAVSVNAVTLLTEDGKEVNRILYEIRNSEKQFLEIRLPKDADVWSVFVGGEPVESSKGSDGRLLVPLIRSRYSGSRLETFPVEIITCRAVAPFRWMGGRGVILPPADVMASQVVWSVYLPNDYRYFNYRSTLEKEEAIRGWKALGMRSRKVRYDKAPPPAALGEAGSAEQLKEFYAGNEAKSRFRNVPMEEEQVVRQMKAEVDFGNKLDEISQSTVQAASPGGAGVMPIQVVIPRTGQLVRFARTIVKPEDKLSVAVWQVRSGVFAFFRVALLALLVWLVFRNRGRLRPVRPAVVRAWGAAVPVLRKIEAACRSAILSPRTLVALIVLAFLSWFVLRNGFVLLLFLFLACSMVQLIARISERRKKPSGGAKRKKKANTD